MVRELKGVLENHRKLISMISEKMLPIKSVLIKDVDTMNSILEQANVKKENKKEESK